jgi:hypothetical protein
MMAALGKQDRAPYTNQHGLLILAHQARQLLAFGLVQSLALSFEMRPSRRAAAFAGR